MLLVEEQIRVANLILPEDQVKLKNSTCDLTIGKIIPMGKVSDSWDPRSKSFLLKPSHMVSVVTAQSLEMPNNVTGIATLVTSLTKQGILCLNVGILDPGYSGPIGATLVNFSDEPRPIKLDGRLFRVLFFDHEPIKNLSRCTVHPVTYAAELTAVSKNEFSNTFLDVNKIVKIAENRAFEIAFRYFSRNILPWMALIASLYAIFWKT